MCVMRTCWTQFFKGTTQELWLPSLILIGPVVSEKVFEWTVNDVRTDKRTTDAKVIYWGNKIIRCRNKIFFLWEQNDKLWEQDIILREQNIFFSRMALISHRSFVTEIRKTLRIHRQYILKRIRYFMALRQNLTQFNQ
jgi:hypothetical protein